jgi:hypothetical protein
MYVGQSENIGVRYRKHCGLGGWEQNFARMAWISELAREGLVPTLRVLAVCEWPEVDEVERRFIREFRAAGHAELNIADGGAGIPVSRLGKTSRDDWIHLARHFKVTRSMLVELQAHLAKMTTANTVDRARKLIHRLENLAAHLGDVGADRFPDWDGVGQLFRRDRSGGEPLP